MTTGLGSLSGYWLLVALEQGAVLESTKGLVGSDDDFLPVFEAAKYFDVGCAGDAGCYGDELGALLAVGVLLNDVNTLNGRGFAG